MRLLGNVIWFVFGGVVMGLAWWLAGMLFYISIIGIPWGKAAISLGTFSFFPFGKTVISRKELTQKDDIGTGALGMFGNVLWFIFAGVWLAIGHIGSGLLCCITVVGIPFGVQHFKLAGASLFPIGKKVVPIELADEARRRNAAEELKVF